LCDGDGDRDTVETTGFGNIDGNVNGGQQNNNQGPAGAAGGGIVIVVANGLNMMGGSIIARGLSVRDSAACDG
jgi:hypothetical protein